MAATVKASADGLERVDKARRKKGWAKLDKAWAELAHTSISTLKRFWVGVAVHQKTFRDICIAVGIEDWQSVVDYEEMNKLQSQSRPIMAATVKASVEGLERVDKARRKKGWAKSDKAWAELARTSISTLKRFWVGVAIQSSSFRDICRAVEVNDWESIIDFEEADKQLSRTNRKQLSFAISGSLDEIDSGKLQAITALLQKLSGDTIIELLEVKAGGAEEISEVEDAKVELGAYPFDEAKLLLADQNSIGSTLLEDIEIRLQPRPLNEAKLLLVGQGSVGKTSLVKRLLDNQFNPNQSQTDGISVRKWPVQINNVDVRLNVWDFGGQEIYHATHQFFLTKRSVYLLVCNCRTSERDNRLEYWLKLIQTFGAESPVIIVGNKKDEQPLDINRRALQGKYPNVKAIIETSCQSGDGIEALHEAIKTEVAQLKDVYNLLPLSWFEVKEKLEQMDEDFISYGQYANICFNQDIPEEENQEQLIELLHRLGIVLNFQDHPILRSTNVLNPDWVTQGIYALLSDDALKTETKGIITPEDISRVLPSDRYPPKRHIYLTELMKEFQLCFDLSDTPGQRLLIPALLPKDEPEVDIEGTTLEFQYRYRVLPGSIISRFIVLSHQKIHEQTYWRSGVVLAHYEGDELYNTARIKADSEDRRIFISVGGRESTRRVFLSMIRDRFTEIHRSLSNLEVNERVPVPDHPDYPPLDYQDLLGLEKMGEQNKVIGKLGIRVNIRQLLDGYEPPEVRQRRYARDKYGDTFDGMHLDDRFEERYGDRYPPVTVNAYINNDNRNTNQQEQNPVSETTNNLQGANIANFANEVKDNARQQANQHIHQAPKQDLAQAAQAIKALLLQLDQSYDSSTPTGKAMISAKTVEAIENNPTLKKRVVNALKEGGTTALEEAIDHPAVKPVVAMVKGFIDA